MTVNEVYNNLGIFLKELVQTQNWDKVELHLKIQPKMLGMSGRMYSKDEIVSIRTKLDNDLKSQVLWLHEETADGVNNKWNRAIFSLTPDNKFNMAFEWDHEWQAEVDKNNRNAEVEDPNYSTPKWHWEK